MLYEGFLEIARALDRLGSVIGLEFVVTVGMMRIREAKRCKQVRQRHQLEFNSESCERQLNRRQGSCYKQLHTLVS